MRKIKARRRAGGTLAILQTGVYEMSTNDLSARVAAVNAASIATTTDGLLIERIRQARADLGDVRANRRPASHWAENADRLLAEIEKRLTQV